MSSDSLSELEEHSLEELAFVSDGLFLIEFFERVNDCLDVLSVKLDGVEEV